MPASVRPPSCSRVPSLLWPLLSAVLSFTLSYAVIGAIWHFYPGKTARQGYEPISLLVSLLLVALYSLVLVWSRRRAPQQDSRRLHALFYLALCGIVLANLFLGLIRLEGFGDAGYLNLIVGRGEVYPRWFLGSAILSKLYRLVVLSLGALWPTAVANPDLYIRACSSLVMTAWSVYLLTRKPSGTSVLFALLTPAWLIFSTGYSEYYPFIAWSYVLYLQQMEQGFANWGVHKVALFAALLVLLYVAFMPLVALLGVVYLLKAGLKKASQVALLAAVYVCAGVLLLWPSTLTALRERFVFVLNLGDAATFFPTYIGQASSASSPFFKTSYAFSPEHLLHVAYMFLSGGGIVLALLLLGGLVYLFSHKLITVSLPLVKQHYPLLLVMTYQLLYFIYMIPKLGPLNDFDLFFAVYLTCAFLLAKVVHKIAKTLSAEQQLILRTSTEIALLAGALPLVVTLMRPGGL